jgi:hypothetical protein
MLMPSVPQSHICFFAIEFLLPLILMPFVAQFANSHGPRPSNVCGPCITLLMSAVLITLLNTLLIILLMLHCLSYTAYACSAYVTLLMLYCLLHCLCYTACYTADMLHCLCLQCFLLVPQQIISCHNKWACLFHFLHIFPCLNKWACLPLSSIPIV